MNDDDDFTRAGELSRAMDLGIYRTGRSACKCEDVSERRWHSETAGD